MSLFLAGLYGEDNIIQELKPVNIQESKSDREKAVLIIDANVPAAAVYLNSVYQGKSKLRIQKLLPAQYILELRKEGMESCRFYVTAKKGYEVTYKIQLKEQNIIEKSE